MGGDQYAGAPRGIFNKRDYDEACAARWSVSRPLSPRPPSPPRSPVIIVPPGSRATDFVCASPPSTAAADSAKPEVVFGKCDSDEDDDEINFKRGKQAKKKSGPFDNSSDDDAETQ